MSFTFSIDINLVVYKSNNLFGRDVVSSGDILNSLTEGSQSSQLFYNQQHNEKLVDNEQTLV